MKILHIINHMGMGGAQSLIVELAPVQRQMGHEVCVLEISTTSDRTLVNKLLEDEIEVVTLSSHRSVRNPLNIFSLIPYIRQYDLIHVHLFPSNYWAAIANMLIGKPIITTEHSTDNKRRKIPIFKYIDAYIYKKYNNVVACSDRALDIFRQRFPRVKSSAIPNGVNLSKYKTAKPYTKQELLGLTEEDFICTMVARFEYPKRQDIVVQAIATLPNRFHVVFVGGSPDDENLIQVKTLAENLRIANRVHFLYVRSDVPRILKTSDIILMSSEYEGLSLSSIEGMASGRPFVASNVNGLKEVVEGAGELFEIGDIDGLSALLMKFASDDHYYKDVVKTCLKRAEEYDISVVADKYQAEYNKHLR